MSEIKPGILAVGVGELEGELYSVVEYIGLMPMAFERGVAVYWVCVAMQPVRGAFMDFEAGDMVAVPEKDLRPLRGPSEQITTDEPAEVTA